MEEFDGKVALVTGGASGIGRASALAFARSGADVLVVDLDAGGAAETVQLIEREGGKAAFLAGDVGSELVADEMVARAVGLFGGLDFAHNNAGISGIPGLVENYDLAAWRSVIDLNLTGVFLCMKYELQQMSSSGSGVIVNTSSVSGLGASPLMPAYVASKHGVLGLTKVAGYDYAKKGIRVNAVCPGTVRTPMMEAWIDGDEAIERLMNDSSPIGRIARPEEIADAVLWLCSERASFVTGAGITVDGGMTSLSGGGGLEE